MCAWRALSCIGGKLRVKNPEIFEFSEIPDFHSFLFFLEFLAAGAQILLEIIKTFLGSAVKNEGRSGDWKQRVVFRP